jgi:long-chain acyl-CoA synthetase
MDRRNRRQGPRRSVEPLWQRVWLDSYPDHVPSSISYPSIPVSELMETAARRFPERVACTLYGQAITYEQLSQRAHGLARSLAALGAQRGQFVAMLLPNTPEYVVALQATWLTGATALQLSPLMVAEEIDKWLKATDCRIIFTLDLLAPNAMKSLERGPLEHVIVASLANRVGAWRGFLYRIEGLRRNGPFSLRENHRVHHFDHFIRSGTDNLAAKVIPEEDVAVLAPTGGTTASPKAVMLTHRNLVANAFQVSAWSDEEDGKGTILSVLPFFHAYGLTVGLLSGLAKAGTIHLHPRFDVKAVLKLIVKLRPELVPAVPALINALNRELQHQPHDLSFIRAVVSGASPLDKNVRDTFMKYGVQDVVEGYGLSEAGPVTHVNPIGERNRVGTIGLPLPDTEARVIDPVHGLEDLPDGQVGELIIRGPQVMKGYFNNPQETARALRGGWL